MKINSEAMNTSQANLLCEALNEALRAMAAYGSPKDEMQVISDMLCDGYIAVHECYRRDTRAIIDKINN